MRLRSNKPRPTSRPRIQRVRAVSIPRLLETRQSRRRRLAPVLFLVLYCLLCVGWILRGVASAGTHGSAGSPSHAR